ncbi:MAG TPA: aminotransferase class V-fold PLP-dependent enzyme [Gemmatimonadaceae bacterium]|nr:aminotransferase class V-fold PLP-dependent enzyme [Gemmatimonadaceae bacterium]
MIATSDRPSYDLAEARARIPILSSAIPMNNCSQAPQTDATRAAAARYLDGWNARGMDWDGWMDEVSRAKAEFARLINASPGEIAVCSSVSAATSAVATALDFTGERCGVVVSEAEFPTVGQVWLAQARRGARIRWAPVRDGAVDADAYEGLIDERTAVVSACHGYYLDGALQDVGALARLAHARGALVYVDGYQSLGTVPLDVAATEVDFLASGNLKFLMGIPGIAFLYVRRALIARLEPLVTGWFGRVDPFGFAVKTLDWSPTASRFDAGTPPVMNAFVARAGMELINRIGVRAIRPWLHTLGQRLIDGGVERGLALYGPADMAKKTATTAFAVDDSHAVELALRERGVIASARGPVIRLAPHYYTSLGDVDAALDALADVLRPA